LRAEGFAVGDHLGDVCLQGVEVVVAKRLRSSQFRLGSSRHEPMLSVRSPRL
jgi:hypothetical protein